MNKKIFGLVLVGLMMVVSTFARDISIEPLKPEYCGLDDVKLEYLFKADGVKIEKNVTNAYIYDMPINWKMNAKNCKEITRQVDSWGAVWVDDNESDACYIVLKEYYEGVDGLAVLGYGLESLGDAVSNSNYKAPTKEDLRKIKTRYRVLKLGLIEE